MIIILGGIFAAALVYNLAMTAFNISSGWRPWHWDRQSQTDALGLWTAIVAAAVVVSAVLFGPVALLSIWGYWLLLIIMSACWFGVGELLARHNERKAARQTLAERMGELRAQGPLPPWAASIESRPAAKRPRGLLARFDDWLGLS